MKLSLLLLTIITLCYKSTAQTPIEEQSQVEKKLMRTWAKYRVEMKDGSQVPDEKIAKNAVSMLIFRRAGALVLISGKTADQAKYVLSGSDYLIINGYTTYKIEKLTENELILNAEMPGTPDNEIIKYYYIASKENSGQYFYRQHIKPFIRVKTDGDTAYNFSEYIYPRLKIETNTYPKIIDDFYQVYEESYNLIEKNFKFPLKTKGNFRVTFAISKTGVLKDVLVKESSDSTYNNKLVQSVYQTRKIWLPAEVDFRKVETLFNFVYVYDGEDKSESQFDGSLYYNIKDKADKQFEKKEYIKAIKLYTKCILMQEEDFDLEPYYKRADSYFALKANKNACLDWSYLSKKGQKKAEKLFFDNCMK
jgi:hypothetical protein